MSVISIKNTSKSVQSVGIDVTAIGYKVSAIYTEDEVNFRSTKDFSFQEREKALTYLKEHLEVLQKA